MFRGAVARFASSFLLLREQPGVPLRSTPGFMLTPAPQAYRKAYLLTVKSSKKLTLSVLDQTPIFPETGSDNV